MADELIGYFDEIMGEMTRGGDDDVMGAPAPARRAPALSKKPLVKARDWTIGLGTTYIKPNATSTVTIVPQVFFRAEKLIATDNASTAGAGTQIVGVTVGNRNQLPVGAGAGGGIPTYTFAANSLGNGVRWDTCQPAISIAIQVQDLGVTAGGSTFSGALFGKCVL